MARASNVIFYHQMVPVKKYKSVNLYDAPNSTSSYLLITCPSIIRCLCYCGKCLVHFIPLLNRF